MSKTLYELQILGRKIKIKSDRDEVHVREVEKFLNSRIVDIRDKASGASTLDIAILAALNIVEDHLRSKETLLSLESSAEEISRLVDESLAS